MIAMFRSQTNLISRKEAAAGRRVATLQLLWSKNSRLENIKAAAAKQYRKCRLSADGSKWCPKIGVLASSNKTHLCLS